MPLKQFSADLIRGDEVLVKLQGPGKLQFRAAEGSTGADVVTKTAKVAPKAGKGVAAAGKGAAGKGTMMTGKTAMPVVAKGTVTAGGITKGAATKGALSAAGAGAKTGTIATAKTASLAAVGTIWKGTGLSLGLGLGLGAAGPVILGGAMIGLGYYALQTSKKNKSDMLDLEYQL
jgi:hypothetical protein